MVFDAACIAHPAGRDNDRPLLNVVDCFALFNALNDPKVLVPEKLGLVYHAVFHRLGILDEHLGRFSGHRRV